MPEHYPDPHGFDSPDAPVRNSKPLSDHERTKMTWPPSSEYRRLQACRDQAEENHTQALIRRVQAYDAEASARLELNRCERQLEDHIKNLTNPK
jgi:hypothetical protein